MNRIEIPKNVDSILEAIEAAGQSAYAVGGCVRDIIMGRTPNDWDITSSATPDEIMRIFKGRAIPTGIKHGTVTVMCGGESFEVTTFRADGAYSDHRRPDSVRFVDALETDLARRDFTINAIAISRDGTLHDPFGGEKDISRKILRCVGSARERFSEDALRMFRALRFCAQIGFDIDEETLSALRSESESAKALASERILSELSKMLLANNTLSLSIMSTTNLLNHLGVIPKERCFDRIALIEPCRLQRWAAFCAIMFDGDFAAAAAFTEALKPDAKLLKTVKDIANIMLTPPQSIRDWKLTRSKFDLDSCRCAAAAMIALGISGSELLLEVLRSGECCTLRQLAVRGKDIKELGISGEDIGKALSQILIYVIDNPQENEKDRLINWFKASR